MSQVATSPKQHKQKQPGLFSSSIFMLFKMALISLLSWFALLVYFTTACFIKGPELALVQAQSIVTLNTDLIMQSRSSLAKRIAEYFYNCHEKLLNVINQYNIFKLSFLQTASHIVLSVTDIILSRLFIFLLAVPLLALILLISATDGLVKRDIRKFQGARESAFAFHRTKHLLQVCFFLPFFIYLGFPFAMTPIPILAIQALLLGTVVWLATTYFKKYL